jgi:hypothetical protein
MFGGVHPRHHVVLAKENIYTTHLPFIIAAIDIYLDQVQDDPELPSDSGEIPIFEWRWLAVRFPL